jgi:hypothetical protein
MAGVDLGMTTRHALELPVVLYLAGVVVELDSVMTGVTSGTLMEENMMVHLHKVHY